ncbi:NAD(P)/FAD-dependent oxidoreductase [Shimia biformata]|uniref:NAD(P)/FAD-dependent oxidoreductase n=1 Tax=Shimia biformata TaxID=1294299 RepID=UPI00195112E5|nr:FAD-binding oxidoreductase [Shimia biformata]
MSDFLIIGGGIAGASAAARLAPLGKVTLLEREASLGYHASGRSAALYESNYGLASTVALSKASGEYFRTAHGGFITPRGLLMLAKKNEGAAFSHACTSLNMPSIPIEDAFAKVPILRSDVVGFAAYHDAAFDIDTDRMIQTFASDARAAGAEVLTGHEVTAITRAGHRWQVTTTKGQFEADILFNASGAWADVVARMAGVAPVGFTPMRRSMARIPAPGGHDVSNWPMILDAREDWYAKPDAGSLIVSPAEEHPMEPFDAWPDDMVLAEGLARYEEHVTEPVTRLESSWAGLRTFSPDRNLVIGPAKDNPAFFWIAGQGGYGFQSAPAASQLVADLVAGRASDLDTKTQAALDPARFA